MTKEERDDLYDLIVFGVAVIFLTAGFYVSGFSSGVDKGKSMACESVGLKYVECNRKCMKVTIEEQS